MGFVMAFLSGVAYGLRWLRAGRFDLHPDAIWGIGVLYSSTGVFCILGSWSRPEWGALEVGTTVGWLIVTGVGLVLALKPCLKRRRPEVD
jgi:hypothetical protein